MRAQLVAPTLAIWPTNGEGRQLWLKEVADEVV
jgi:hypothetical protein